MRAKYYILFIFMVVTVSCSVDSYLSTTKNHDPEINFKDEPTKILVVNTFDFGRLGLNNQKKLDVMKNGAYTSINYAGTRLKILKGITVISLADSNHMVISIDSLSKLITKYHADYVLALDEFYAGFDADNIQDHQDGADKKKTYKTADYSMKVTANYKLYDKSGNVYKLLKGRASDFKTTQEIPGAFWASLFGPGVKNNGANVDQSAIHATDDALRPFFGYVTTKSRPLYSNDELSEAVGEITSGNFSKADSLLKPLIYGADQKLAAKAAYNLAVVYEAQGNIKAAMDMVQLSIGKDDNSKANTLLSELSNATATAVSP
ncbi:hypothetical protein KXQ82_03910 [Mucilaginibacter sp. HMF5004]|uniref:DUF6340 family protein n=1 Tax=Mucilaginibacter rivuli TaxID=2857527 RepID=UPI001C5CE6A2|nr:DUF6340 family protein [Mucilaginibacter rivuli]MBW4888840.1 hypothetical protein [Mucilaginibacter rivuli]